MLQDNSLPVMLLMTNACCGCSAADAKQQQTLLHKLNHLPSSKTAGHQSSSST
jgi:hypothetical protein